MFAKIEKMQRKDKGGGVSGPGRINYDDYVFVCFGEGRVQGQGG